MRLAASNLSRAALGAALTPQQIPCMVQRARPDNETLLRLWGEYRSDEQMEARNALIEYYRPYAVSLARRVKSRLPKSVEIGDLEGAGDVGLIQAIQSFDPERGVPFEAFCEHRVRGAILDELRRHDWLPRPVRTRVKERRAMLEGLRSRIGREPTDSEAAEEMGISLSVYQRTFAGRKEAPLLAGAKTSEDGDSDGTLDFFEDPRQDGPDADPHRRELLALIAQSLDDEAREIVFLRFFLDSSLRDIADLKGISQSRVSKILGKIMERLKEKLQEKI